MLRDEAGEYRVSHHSPDGAEAGAYGEGIVLRARGSLRPIALRTAVTISPAFSSPLSKISAGIVP